jgi:hypothetical protein
MDKIELEQSLARDRVRHLKLDAAHTVDFGRGTLELKAGLKAQRRSKTNEEEVFELDAGDLSDPPYSRRLGLRALASYTLAGRVPLPLGRVRPGLERRRAARLCQRRAARRFP